MPLIDGHGPGRILVVAKVTSLSQNARSHRLGQPPIARQMPKLHRRTAGHQIPLGHTPQVLTGSRVRPRAGVRVVVLRHHCFRKPVVLAPAETTRMGCRLGRQDWIRSLTRPYGATLARVMQAAQAAPLKSELRLRRQFHAHQPSRLNFHGTRQPSTCSPKPATQHPLYFNPLPRI